VSQLREKHRQERGGARGGGQRRGRGGGNGKWTRTIRKVCWACGKVHTQGSGPITTPTWEKKTRVAGMIDDFSPTTSLFMPGSKWLKQQQQQQHLANSAIVVYQRPTQKNKTRFRHPYVVLPSNLPPWSLL